MQTLSPPQWHCFASSPALEQAASHTVLQAAQQSIAERGAFHLVLAGGSTPRKVYGLLRNADTQWSAWHIYFGDERCLPAEDDARNSRMATTVWLDHVNIPNAQIHCIPAERGAQAAAHSYAATLKNTGPFDLVLLGMGEDGHTASLFPGHPLGNETTSPDVMAVFDAPKPPAERVSLSARRLSQSRDMLFMITGSNKRTALEQWHNGQAIPAAIIANNANCSIYIDQFAAPPNMKSA